jgi:hypothetical protein
VASFGPVSKIDDVAVPNQASFGSLIDSSLNSSLTPTLSFTLAQ